MLDPIRSERITDLVQSEIRAMTQRSVELNAVNLGQGVCDTPPPGELVSAVLPAIENGKNIYTRYDGTGRLRRALARKLSVDNGLGFDAETEIVATVGSTGAFAATLMALCNPGDRILMFEPFYGYHLNTALVAGLQPELVPLTPSAFGLDIERLDAMAAGARALVVNTPANPCGRVFAHDELEAIADICQRHNLLCITDEIYEYFVYDSHRHISLATLPGMRDRTVTISGYSKTFSITGWRIGYLAAPRELAGPIGLVNDLYYVCAPSPLQYAVADAIDSLDAGYYDELARHYQQKRDRFCAVLEDAGLAPHVPEGAYYVLADISSLGCKTASEAAMRLLEEAHVASIPGSAFFHGEKGEKLTRFCFAKDDATLDRASELLDRWSRAGHSGRRARPAS